MRVKHSLKRLTSLLLCLVMLAQMVVVSSAAEVDPATEAPTPTAADAFEVKNGAIVRYNGSDSTVVIPAKIGDMDITMISKPIEDNSTITTLVVPSSITSVYGWPSNVSNIYFYGECPAFYGTAGYYSGIVHCKANYKNDFIDYLECTILGDVVSTLEVPAYASEEPEPAKDTPATKTPAPTAATAFTTDGDGWIEEYNGTDTDIVIPAKIGDEEIIAISGGAFMALDMAITSITIPSTIIYVGSYAFDGNSSLTDLYFYGEPNAFEGDTFDDDEMSVTIHCKESSKDTFDSYGLDDFTAVKKIVNDIDDDLADPVYGAVDPDPTEPTDPTEPGEDGDDDSEFKPDPTQPEGSEKNPIQITDAAGLIALSDKVYGGDTCKDIYYRLMNDIQLDSSTKFRPIGTNNSTKYFSGHFDGGNHAIKGLNVDYYDYAGLFGSVREATIENLTVEGSVKGGNNSAGIVGYAVASTLRNLCNKADVSAKSTSHNYIGGVAGYIGGDSYGRAGTTVENCCNHGTITGQYNNSKAFYGGVVGYAFANGSVTNTIQNCYNDGTVKSTAYSYGNVGGIVGGASGTSSNLVISNCANKGTVTAPKSGTAEDIVASEGKKAPTNCLGKDASVADILSVLGEGFTTDSDGNIVLKWQVSGDSKPACEHEKGDVVKTTTTCANLGETTYKCSKCGEEFTVADTVLADHKWDENSRCTVCGANQYNFEIRDGKAWVIGYTGKGGNIILPSKYKTQDGKNEYDVVGVKEGAFCGNGNYYYTGHTAVEVLETITSITVPASITTVEKMAFNYVGRNMTNTWKLTSIKFEAEDVTFGESALGGNPNLTSVTLPSKLTEIGVNMFSGDTKLANLEIPETVTKVNRLAFNGCTSLKALTFKQTMPPEMVQSIGFNPDKAWPFVGCTGLTLYVPNASLEAYQTAWADMLAADISLKGDITLAATGGNVVFVSDFKYYPATADTSKYLEFHVISLNNDNHSGTVELKYVGYNVGRYATGTLDIPETVTTKVVGQDWTFTVVGIGEKAMDQYTPSKNSSSNYWFTSVNFPSTLTYIEKQGCDGLERVTEIDLSGTAITRIGVNAFRGCKSATVIKLPDTLETLGEGQTETIIVGDKSFDNDAASTDPAADKNVSVGGGVDNQETFTYTYQDNVFACCDVLEKFEIGNNPHFSVVDGVLYYKDSDGKQLICYPNGKKDTTFTVPADVTSISSEAFMVAAGNNVPKHLNTLTFAAGSQLKHVAMGAFRQSSITEVVIPAGVTFGSSVFANCDSLTKVTIEEGVTTLSAYMFWGCKNLTEVNFPDSLKNINHDCFGSCTSLASIDLNKVVNIGEFAFYNTGLTTLTIPSSVVFQFPGKNEDEDANASGRGAFSKCANLKTVVFAEGCKNIAPFMFTSDDAMTSVTLANSIERIGEYAFNRCQRLETVTLPTGLATMGNGVFYNCSNLKTATFPDGMKLDTLPSATFGYCVDLETLYLGKSIKKTAGTSLALGYDYTRKTPLTVKCAVAESAFQRSAFDLYYWDLDSSKLFTGYQDSGNKDLYGNIIYNATVSASGAGTGGCGGGVTEGQVIPVDSTAQAVFEYGDYEPIELTITIKGCDGNDVTKGFTKSDLLDLAEEGQIVYQYWPPVGMGGGANAIVGTKYITIEKLLSALGVDTFGTGDTLTVIPTDNKNLSVNKTELDTCKYYFDAEGVQNEVPAALLLSWNSGKLADKDGNVLTTEEELAKTAYDSGNIRFGYGVSQEQYDNRNTTGLRGMRLVSNVTTLSFVQVHTFTAETADSQYLKSAATCTDKAVYYKSCANCGLTSEGTADEATFASGDVLGHDYGAWTANDNGTHTRVCKTDSSHTETAKCADGNKDHNCDVCGNELSKCVDNDKDHNCDTCGKKLTDHTGGTATCAAKAVCEICGEAYGELASDNHPNLKHIPAKDATKWGDGNIEYWYCADCDKYYSDAEATKSIAKADTVIPAKSDSGNGSSGSTSTGSNSTSDKTDKDKTDKTVKSQNTGDMGIAMYVGLSLLSLTGSAWVAKKNRKVR